MIRGHIAPGLLAGLVAIVAAFAIGQTAGGDVMKTFYVSTGGDDANPGTRERPLATLGAAREAVRQVNPDMTSDIEVVLHDGTYWLTETLALDHRDGGTNGHNVVYRAAPGASPVLSGGKVVTGWEEDAGGR